MQKRTNFFLEISEELVVEVEVNSYFERAALCTLLGAY